MRRNRNLIDDYSCERSFPGELIEYKSMTETRSRMWGPVWLTTPIRTRWYHLLPLACLLACGAAVPGFLITLVVVLAASFVALIAFFVLVQLPIGYLARYLKNVRAARDERLGKLERPSPSSGI